MKCRLKNYLCICILSVCIHTADAAEWQTPQTTTSWKGVWGIPDDNAIYLGMWTYHIRPNGNRNNNNTNRMIGINIKGIFFSEFVNSFYKRSYSIGLQRLIYSEKFDHDIQFDIGYRLGVIWGYKGTHLFGNKPVPFDPLPVPQVIMNVSWEVVGIQFSYCVAVVTAGFFVKI